MKAEIYQKLLEVTKENHWESSQQYLSIIQTGRLEQANTTSMALLLSMQEWFNAVMKEWLMMITNHIAKEFKIDWDKFIKIEFWPISDEHIWVTLFHTITNKFYIATMKRTKEEWSYQFDIINIQEK